MTPFSTGLDLVEVPRIRALLAKHGNRFKERTFTAGEIAYCDAARIPPSTMPPVLRPRRLWPRRWEQALPMG